MQAGKMKSEEARRRRRAELDRAYRKRCAERIRALARERYAANAERMRAYRRARYAADPEKYRQAARQWMASNRDKVRQKNVSWNRANRERRKALKRRYQKKHRAAIAARRAARAERIRAVYRLWVEKNRARVRRRVTARRARKIGAAGYHTAAEFHAVCKAHDWRCEYCQCQLDERTVTEDHRIPLSRGGSDWIDNIAPCCLLCNSSKRALTDMEFIEFGGRIVA